MGMSASQARYIALTARMSDTEYEAQQINQQRLTLSNKMNEIQEQAMNMDVPTPPAKQDFMVDSYTGKTKSGQPLNVLVNNDGSITVIPSHNGTIVERGDKLDVTNGASVNLVKTTMDSVAKTLEKGREFTVKVPGIKEELKEVVQQPAAQNTQSDVPESGEATDANETAQTNQAAQTEPEVTYESTGRYILDNEKTMEVKVKADGSLEPAEYQLPAGAKLAEGVSLANQTCKFENKEYTFSQMKTFAKNALTQESIENVLQNYRGENGKSLSLDDIVNDKTFFQVKQGAVIYEQVSTNPDAKETTVNGRTVLSIDDAKSLYGNDATSSFGHALSGLEHSYGDESDNWINEWSVIVDNSGKEVTYSFCKTEDLNNSENGRVQTYVTTKGTYEDDPVIIPTDDIVFDETGHIAEIYVDGDKIRLLYGQEVDEVEYDLAMNKYNIEKAMYDQEQNELNKKTSIYQRQDKQLELKLTRLDSERNALNTELEAVKKVIQDAIDKGFKTFSG